MQRFHVHLGVPDLQASIRFYSDLFGMPPSVEKPDYAKWMLDDPRVNFAISERGGRAGLDHLGLQADSADELARIRMSFAAADAAGVEDEHEVACCYARSNKHWVRDPQGIRWEAFQSLAAVQYFDADADAGNERPHEAQSAAKVGGQGPAACCAPPAADAPSECCAPSSQPDTREPPRRCCA